MTQASAPGKIILFGEHAVVYGQPAIAAPVTQVRATAEVENAAHAGVLLRAPDLREETWLAAAAEDHPLGAAVRAFEAVAGPVAHLTATVTSTIPIASGLGSGAAIAACLIRALARHLGREDLATDAAVSTMTFEVEKRHHGTPSGIDNTVVSYEQPVYFRRAFGAQPSILSTLTVGRPLYCLIANTGVIALTKESVGDVRRQWLAEPERFETLFARCGQIAQQARAAIERGDQALLGQLMGENHAVLQAMTVSSAELDRLVTAALAAGALGAKMSGGGRGGNMIALVDETCEADVREALTAAGATSVLETLVAAS